MSSEDRPDKPSDKIKIEEGVKQKESSIPQKGLSGFFSNPVVGVVGSIASIISLFLAVYFYIEGKEIPELTYSVHPAKAVVAQAGQSVRLATSYDGKQVNTDVTIAQIAIWNRGKLAIKKINILKPFVLYTTDNTPILEATIRKVSRDVVGLDLKAEEISQGRLTISWDILEHNDGGIIQIIYAGSPSVTIQAEGILEVQNEIKHTKSLEKGGEVIYNPVRSSYTGLAYGLVIAGIFGLFIIWMGSAVQRHFNLPTKFPLIEMLFCVVCFGLAFYLIFIVKDPSPPFSF